MNIYDTHQNTFFDIDPRRAEEFIEEYPEPHHLVVIDSLLYFDGSGWNGSRSAVCFGTPDNLKAITLHGPFTNNEAEYLACFVACTMAKKGSWIVGDSRLVINQVKGLWACKEPRLQQYHKDCAEMYRRKNLTFIWVPRYKNIAGIQLDSSLKRLKQ